MACTLSLQQYLRHIPFYPTAITARGLAKVWQLEDGTDTSRAVRRVVRALIGIGCPIMSGSRGYSQAKSIPELSDHIEKLKQRHKALDERIVDLQWIIAHWEGQS